MRQCDPESEAYLSFLSRECSLPTNEVALHIYFKRLPVDVHSAEVLASLEGSKILFESRDTGKAKLLDKTIDSVLSLKPKCRVMLTGPLLTYKVGGGANAPPVPFRAPH